jgi:peroxiredoxin
LRGGIRTVFESSKLITVGKDPMFNPFKKKLKIGDMAPDFSLPSHLGGRIKLSGFRGKRNVLVAFYPLDWTPV